MNKNTQDPPLSPVGSLFPSDVLAEYLKDYLEEYNEEQSWGALTAMFNIDKHKNFTKARSVILDYHLGLDGLMSRAIFFLCVLGAKSMLVIDFDKFLDAISWLGFKRKIDLMASLQICSGTSLSIMEKINDIRNAFAHTKKIDDKAFIYAGEPIFLLKGIEKVRVDYYKVVEEFYKQFDKIVEQIKK